MPIPEDWDAADAVAACPALNWENHLWRMHHRKYPATDPGGSLKTSGRYHKGLDYYSVDQMFSALYLSTSPDIVLGELLRHVTAEVLPTLNNIRRSKLLARLEVVLDCRNHVLLGLNYEDLIHDTDVEVTREIGAAAFARGVEGILVVSATELGDNLVVFPTNLGSDSQLTVISSIDPRLQPG